MWLCGWLRPVAPYLFPDLLHRQFTPAARPALSPLTLVTADHDQSIQIVGVTDAEACAVILSVAKNLLVL